MNHFNRFTRLLAIVSVLGYFNHLLIANYGSPTVNDPNPNYDPIDPHLSTIDTPEYSRKMYRQFATNKMLKEAKSISSDYRNILKNVEKRHEKYDSARIKPKKLALVFHVLHSKDIGYVDEKQIHEQVALLNSYFQPKVKIFRHEADVSEGFGDQQVDTEISFCIAATDDRTAKPMIYYYDESPIDLVASEDMKFRGSGGADVIEPDRFVNIWVCDLEGDQAGYSTFPGSDPTVDGIVIDYQFFGVSRGNHPQFNQGKTLVHLMGSYLHLIELWGLYPCGDDYLFDTPIHNGPNYGCPGYRHISSCGGNQIEMTMNFMDNTNDACMYMFTEGQKYRMHSVLAVGGPRASLLDHDRTLCSKEQLPEVMVDQAAPLPLHFKLSLAPNPARDRFFITMAHKEPVEVSINIYDINAKIVHTQQIVVNQRLQLGINCTDWTPGVYSIICASPHLTDIFPRKIIVSP